MENSKKPTNIVDQIIDDSADAVSMGGEISKSDLFAGGVVYSAVGLALINKDTFPDAVKLLGVFLVVVGFVAMLLIKRRL